jgi:hypothetical protein
MVAKAAAPLSTKIGNLSQVHLGGWHLAQSE